MRRDDIFEMYCFLLVRAEGDVKGLHSNAYIQNTRKKQAVVWSLGIITKIDFLE